MNEQQPPTPGEGGFDISQLGEMLQKIGQMMAQTDASDSGAVSWSTVRQSAREAISKNSDPSVSESERTSVNGAVALAQTWLDGVVPFPPAGLTADVWCKSEWLEATLDQWQPLINPVGEALGRAMGELAEQSIAELSAAEEGPGSEMLRPMLELAKRMSAISTSTQIGTGLAALAEGVLSAGDGGLPLQASCTPALLPKQVEVLAREHDLPLSETMLFIAIRECAVQRLFHAYPWLRQQVATGVSRYAKGIHIDGERIRDAMSEIDPTDLGSMQALATSGAFQPVTSDDQQRELDRVELLLATIEGWVSAVTELAIDGRLASLPQLTETWNRRRAEGGPAEQTFANLVGLSLRPRLMRTATAFFKELLLTDGSGAHDSVWAHPDLLPSSDELADVALFRSNRA